MNARQLRDKWDQLSAIQQEEIFPSLSAAEKEIMLTSWEFVAHPHQLLPIDFDEKYNKAMILGGRGPGKTYWLTRTGLHYIHKHWDIPLSLALVNKTWDDVLGINIEGLSGFQVALREQGYTIVHQASTQKKEVWIKYSKGAASIRFFNGAIIRLFSGQKPDAFAGYQYHIILFDELFLYDKCEYIWRMARFCMRLVEIKPLIFIASTPRPKYLTKKIFYILWS